MNNINNMKTVIDKFYSQYPAISSEIEEILIDSGASGDDSSEEGYFTGMTDSQVETCYSKIRDLIKYRHENINPYYFTEDTLVDFDLQDLVFKESLSIYEQMDKIDDNDSLSEKYYVKSLQDTYKIKESVSKSELLNEDLEDYHIIYYLDTAAYERRKETVEDVERGWMEDTFSAESEYDALLYALECIDSSYDEDDFSTSDEIVNYFEEKDLGDGSAFVIKLEGPNGVIYDMGYTKESYIDEFVSKS